MHSGVATSDTVKSCWSRARLMLVSRCSQTFNLNL